jgi:hypothetical protein
VLEDVSKTWQRKGPSVGVLVALIVLALGGGLAYFAWEHYQNRPANRTVLTEEAKQYLPYLDLSDVRMEAKESFLGHTIVSIEGKISNLGERGVRVVEVTCVFRDPYLNELGRQAVVIVRPYEWVTVRTGSINELGRQAVVIVSPQAGLLDPGQTRPFRIAFDAVPQGWNQIMPNLYIAQIQFE